MVEMRPADKVMARAEGLQVLSASGPSLLMHWDEVFAVSFSKIDAIDYTITYLNFDYDYGEFVETHDFMEGFRQLVADLPEHLPIADSGWQKAMQAAMAGVTRDVYMKKQLR